MHFFTKLPLLRQSIQKHHKTKKAYLPLKQITEVTRALTLYTS